MKLITGWLTCRGGTRDEFLAAMADGAAATRREEGCVFFEYHEDVGDPDGVVLIEGFRDDAAHQIHRHTSHMADMQAEVRRYLTRIRLIEAVSSEFTSIDLDLVASPLGPWKP
jgi:quinol monooxygenase YgiN